MTLEELGFKPHLIETILRENIGNDLKTMFWWSCLNLDHDELPIGFIDKHEHAQNEVIFLSFILIKILSIKRSRIS